MKKLIKSAGFQTFLFVVLAFVILYWAMGLANDYEGVSAARETASTTQARTTDEIVTPPSNTDVGEVTSFAIDICEVELKIVGSGHDQSKKLVLYQRNLPVASVEIPEGVDSFRVLSYEIGATHAAYIDVELGGKFVEAISNDMYWLNDAKELNGYWRIEASMRYVDDVFAVTTTTKSPTDGLSCHLNTQWKLDDSKLYADDEIILYRVLSAEYFPLVQTSTGWSMVRYDQDEGWIAIPFKLYESDQQEFLKLIESISGIASNEAQHGIESRLGRFGFTSDDVDTARHTYHIS